MLTNLHAAVVMIVFAGGPHTAPRTEYAERLLPQIAPQVVHLTGAEFAGAAESSNAVLAAIIALQRRTKVSIDASASTLQSCRHLAREIPRHFAPGSRLVVVTSDYHAARVVWLLRGLLPRGYTIDVRRSPDMPWQTALDTPLNRTLLRGEVLSWLYCLPLGLVLRPAPLWLLAVASIGSVMLLPRLRPRLQQA